MINEIDLRAIVALNQSCDGPQRNYTVTALNRILVPAMEVNQYVVVPGQWYATWGFFNDNQVQQFMCMDHIDRPWTDREDTTLWLIDLVTHPSVDRASLVPHLMRAEWMTKTKHQVMYFARTYGTRQFQRVGKIVRREDNAELAQLH